MGSNMPFIDIEMSIHEDEVHLERGVFSVAVGVTNETYGCYVTITQMAHIFDIPKNTLEARMKSMSGNFGLLKKMITQKSTLDELRRCGGVGEHARPSKLLMYSIADFMIALVGKIRKEDAREFKRLSVAACKGKLYRKVLDQGDDQGGQDGGDSNDEGYLEQLAEVSNAYGSAGDLFSPVRGIPGCNSPIILENRPPGRPSGRSISLPGHRSQVPSLPSTSIVLYQSPAPAMVPSTLLSPSARTYTFPTELPTIQLHLSQMKERYGIPRSEIDPELASDIESFKVWCRNPFQLDRIGTYARPVQTETWESCFDIIRGYMGYGSKYHTPPRATLPLSLKDAYSNPHIFVSFVSYIRARGVRKGFICTHIKVAKKVNKFFEAKSTVDADTSHFVKMHEWLVTLDYQIIANMVEPKIKRAIPDCEHLHAWVDRLAEGAKKEILQDRPGPISYTTAITTQAAIIAMFVTGRHTGAPCRLSSIKSVIHPSFVGTLGACLDPDCPYPAGTCSGNRFEIKMVSKKIVTTDNVSEATGSTNVIQERRVRFVIPHHKNERHNSLSGQDIEYDLPSQPNPLTKLLLVHIDEGQSIIQDHCSVERTPFLFLTNQGRPFTLSKSTFTAYWKQLMDRTAPANVIRFPPSLARKSFVEWYTLEYGEEPDMWDGAADIMGNSVRKWREVYNVSNKKRRMQKAVDRFSERHSAADASWDDDLDLPHDNEVD
jgi:hypothetical protein